MIRVHFIGARGAYQSIETQAVRIERELARVGSGRVSTRLTLLSQDEFRPRGLLRRRPWRKLAPLLDDTDIVVFVKSSLLRGFVEVSGHLRDLCRARGVVLVSNPCDGPGADGGDTSDPFSVDIADFVLTISSGQHEDLVRERSPEEVFLVYHASRLEQPCRVPFRETVQRILWENPVHHNPRYDPRKAGGSRESLAALERLVRDLADERGAELVVIDAWRETQSYEEWERIVLDCDVAIECKALDRQWVEYQRHKPAVKVLNYLSLGLPVICDSVPAYRDLGRDGEEILFADDLETWRARLSRLLDDPELRRRLGEAGWRASRPFQIDRICERYIETFRAMLERKRRPRPLAVPAARGGA